MRRTVTTALVTRPVWVTKNACVWVTRNTKSPAVLLLLHPSTRSIPVGWEGDRESERWRAQESGLSLSIMDNSITHTAAPPICKLLSPRTAQDRGRLHKSVYVFTRLLSTLAATDGVSKPDTLTAARGGLREVREREGNFVGT